VGVALQGHHETEERRMGLMSRAKLKKLRDQTIVITGAE
jgi:hypothetical protein